MSNFLFIYIAILFIAATGKDKMYIVRFKKEEEKLAECLSMNFKLLDSILQQAGPQHTNVAIIFDVGNTEGLRSYSKDLLTNVLNDISLLKYRVSFFTTNGVTEKLIDFQSRQCILGKLSVKQHRRRRLTNVIRKAAHDLNGSFSKDHNIVLLLTDKPKSKWLIKELNKLARKHKNKGIYVNLISKQQRYDEEDISRHSRRHISRETYPFSSRNYHQQRNKVEVNKKIQITTIRDAKAVARQLPFSKGKTNQCHSNQRHVRDECNRRCECINGKLANCVRIRQEFSSMTKTERLRFIHTYKEFSSNKKFEKTYSKYVKYHYQFFFKGLHNKPQFFPWHRKYILGFENYLRLFDCRVTVPYWNWALHQKQAWKVTPNHHTWCPKTGLGGNGVRSNGFCVATGFLSKNWKPPKYEKSRKLLQAICDNNEDFQNKYVSQICKNRELFTPDRCLRRRFNGKTPTYKNLYNVIKNKKTKDFTSFERIVRVYWHNLVHNHVGGEMETNYSSNTPEFWMHHGMLDCAWEKWQQKGHSYKYKFFKNKTYKLLAFESKELRHKYVQNDNLGDCGIKVTCENVLPMKVKKHLKSRYYKR